jgi:hypothetical protein
MRCPLCGAEGHPEIDPGEPTVTSGPPDRWDPGSPAYLIAFEGCDCFDLLLRDYPVLDEEGEVISEGWDADEYANAVLAEAADIREEDYL